VRYLTLADYCEIAAEILGTDPKTIAGLPNIGLAESALLAPAAGFGDQDVYPTLLEKAAVLLERLTKNHPLPDGNKRSAFVAMGMFLEINDQPLRGSSTDEDVDMVERIAASDIDASEIVAWLERRTSKTRGA
jgi:death on curing protein